MTSTAGSPQHSPAVRWRLISAVRWLLLAGGGIAFVYWLRFAPVSVTGLPVERGTLVGEVLGTGTLEARVSATISSRIAGRVAEVLVDQGDTVRAGDLLVRLDDEELQQQVAIAEANVAAAQAAVTRLTADKGRAAAVFDQAERHHGRISRLLSTGTATQEEFDRAAEALAVAVADVSRSEAGISEAQQELVAAEKTLEYHRARLRDTRVVAPFDGLIVSRQREAGDVVVPGSATLTLISTDVLWIQAWVDETEMGRLQEGQPARVVLRSDPQRTLQGKVVRLGRQADRETREFVVDVQVLELPEHWAVGQRAEVYIETDRQLDALIIPARLLVHTDAGDGVFVLSSGTAVWRALTVGLQNRESVEVVSGLLPTDLVLEPVNSGTRLSSGQKVHLP